MAFRMFGITVGKREPEKPVERSAWFALGNGYGGWGYPISGGLSDSYSKALRNSASWACIDVLCDAIARTPVDAVRYQGGARIPVVPQPRVLAHPSGVVTSDVWLSQLAWSLVTDGNAFGHILGWAANGKPSQIEWLDATTVTDRKLDTAGVKTVKIGQKPYRCYPYGDIFHIPGRMIRAGSPFGESPLAWANHSIGTSLAAEDYSQRWFTDGGHPTALYRSDIQLTDEQIAELKKKVRAAEANREPIVMGAGIEREVVQDSPDKTVLDVLQYEVVNVCRFWHVPPSWVYAAISGQNVTYANLAQDEASGLKNTLDGYYVRIERALSELLPEPQFVKMNRDAILRSDIVTRYQVYATALENDLGAVNEFRALEDKAPWPDRIYDQPGLPGKPAAPAPTPQAEAGTDGSSD